MDWQSRDYQNKKGGSLAVATAWFNCCIANKTELSRRMKNETGQTGRILLNFN